MEIKLLKKEITSKMIRIPNFIDTTSSLHYLVWNSGIGSINAELLKLITNTILTEKTVFRIYTNVTALLDDLCDITSNDLQLKILVYYSKLFLYLEDYTIENENYEVAANLKTFTDLYYQIKIIK